MAEMKTDAATLAQEAGNFERISGDLKTQIDQVESTAGSLQGQWRGAAGTAAQAAVVRFQLRQALPAARRYGSSGRYGSAAVLRPQCFVSAGARIGKPTEAQRPDSAPDVRRPVGAVRVGPAAATPTPTSASANSDADRRRRAALAGTGRI